MISSAVQVEADPHVFLTGHPPVDEFIGYLKRQTLEGRAGDVRALMDAWRAGNDHFRSLEAEEAGYADVNANTPLPDELKLFAEHVIADPVVQRGFALAPIEIAMVELDRLVVFQKHINLAFVDELLAQLGEDADSKSVFGFALPYEQRNDPPVADGQLADGSWIFKSVSSDFRILGAELVEPEQVIGLNSTGVPSKVIAVSVGYGSNYLSALSVEGRLVLNNGSHRAYALRAAGHKYVPCLVQHVSRREELRVLINDGNPLLARTDEFLQNKRPPLFKDYFDEKLRMIVHVPRTIRQVQLGFTGGAADLLA